MAMPTKINGNDNAPVSAVDASCDMFAGLGLNQFTGGGTANHKPQTPTPVPNPVSASTSKPSNLSLSLEEKQK